MLKNSSILITGGTGSFDHAFIPMTLEKYNLAKNRIIGFDYVGLLIAVNTYGKLIRNG
jgi:FlaA1/EpsC-like NDP-sugar epimerase